jgi:hypothetical protein
MKKINNLQKIFSLYFIATVVLWVVLAVQGSKSGNGNYWYSFLFGLTPLLAGIIGMVKAGIWGRFRSALGKAVFFISLGLALWGFGETIWSYYNFFKNVPAPYPSIADIGFAPSIFFWVLGAGYLSRATGALMLLKRSRMAKLFSIIAILGLAVLSYYLLIKVARGGVLVPTGETALKTVLDIVYPLGDFLAVNFAFLVFILSFKYFGGFYRTAIGAILFGLGVMYIGDIVFSYTTTTGSYYNADWGDLILNIGLACLSFGILGFSTRPQIEHAAAVGSREE